MPRQTDGHLAEVEQRILEAAKEIVAATGFRALSTRAIEKKIGLSRTAVNSRFRGDQLTLKLVADAYSTIPELIRQPSTPRDTLYDLLYPLAERLATDTNCARLMCQVTALRTTADPQLAFELRCIQNRTVTELISKLGMRLGCATVQHWSTAESMLRWYELASVAAVVSEKHADGLIELAKTFRGIVLRAAPVEYA